MQQGRAERNWYNLEPDDVIRSLSSSSHGLNQEEVQKRLAQFGHNELRKKEKISPWKIFLQQFKSVLIVILLIAVALSGIVGEVADAILIAVIVAFCSILGFIQEYRAERALEALKKMAAPTATVLRDGKEMEIAASELVPGDIILLRTGDRIPADARLIEAVNLKTDEAPLTGESVPIEKISDPLEGEVSLGDTLNVIFGDGSKVVEEGVEQLVGFDHLHAPQPVGLVAGTLVGIGKLGLGLLDGFGQLGLLDRLVYHTLALGQHGGLYLLQRATSTDGGKETK